MLERRTRFHADVLSGRILAVGGGTLLGKLTNTMEAYTPAENQWECAAPLPVPVADHAGATHKGILYVSGNVALGTSGASWRPDQASAWLGECPGKSSVLYGVVLVPSQLSPTHYIRAVPCRGDLHRLQ